MLTIVIPVFNEADSLRELHGEISRVCAASWEKFSAPPVRASAGPSCEGTGGELRMARGLIEISLPPSRRLFATPFQTREAARFPAPP